MNQLPLTPPSETWEQKARRLALELKELRSAHFQDGRRQAQRWMDHRNKKYELELHLEAVD